MLYHEKNIIGVINNSYNRILYIIKNYCERSYVLEEEFVIISHEWYRMIACNAKRYTIQQ